MTAILKEAELQSGPIKKEKLKCWIEDGQTIKQLALAILHDTHDARFSREGKFNKRKQ